MATSSKNELMLIENISIIDYYNRFITPLGDKYRPMSDNRFTSLCPFHDDTDPSFHYWKKKRLFYCFGCERGGNVVRLHMLTRQMLFGDKLDINSAIRDLASAYNLPLEEEIFEEGTKTVFEIARNVLISGEAYRIPKGVLTLASFRQLNNKVINAINVSTDTKIANFEQLDAYAALFLSSK